MIVAENKTSTLDEFRLLMCDTDNLLNSEAVGREAYYATRNGIELECDVFDAVKRAAKGTSFDNTIELVSGASFPDIVANGYYGVEVKSTNKNQWKSIGSSILESTRIESVERIFLTFGKLGSPVSFRSRPYEECLYGISVTHYPRYQIDMELQTGETIFDKMGIAYDVLRKMENPVGAISDYYRSKLRPGESLWWAGKKAEETSAPMLVRLWSTLEESEKKAYTMQGYAFFPEILGHAKGKYKRFTLWLATTCGVINSNIRDQFSSGGRVDIITNNKVFSYVPAVFGRIQGNRTEIKSIINEADEIMLRELWNVRSISSDRIEQWCEIAASFAQTSTYAFNDTYEMLKGIFDVN